MTKKFYVTTPIYYANAEPHIGSAYATLSADIIARYYRIKYGNENVLSLVGTDEHGQKIAEEANKKGVEPKLYVDSLVPTFKDAWKSLNIDFDVFMRTTDPSHENEASRVIQKIYDKGYIYSGTYEGLYCVGCEKFLTEKDLVNGKCPLHPNREPVYQKERNYFFKLKDFQNKLIELFENDKVEILPKYRKREVLNRIKEGLEDISVSREGVSWGVPVPWDKSHTIYVWVEALLNYYTATKTREDWGRFWPADVHIVGKDIIWFHTVIWCALLMAAEISLPKTVFGHGFLTLKGQKISKSLGNVISPKELIDQYGLDGTRYLLASAATFGEDRNIDEGEFDEKFQADLANGLGNLVARVETLAEKIGIEADSEIPGINTDVAGAIERYELDKGLDFIRLWISGLDKYLNQERPWEKSASESKQTLLAIIKGAEGVKSIKEIASSLRPYLPDTAEEILRRFSGTVRKGKILFPRLK